MVKINEIREGSIVRVSGSWGGEVPKRAIVVSVEDDIKNGIPGIDYTVISNGDEHWAYIQQVVSVEKY